MKSQISDLLDMIDELQGKLEAEFSKRRAELNVRLEKGKGGFRIRDSPAPQGNARRVLGIHLPHKTKHIGGRTCYLFTDRSPDSA